MQILLLGHCLLILPRIVAGLCECGYVANDLWNGTKSLPFTNAFESDFVNSNEISKNKHWRPQKFDVTVQAARGKYGMAFTPDNVASCSNNGDARDFCVANEKGLALRVSSQLKGDAIPVAEVAAVNSGFKWGSYRAGMKFPAVNGTCAAFFWYFNDTQEIDFEFLSREYNSDEKLFPVNLVIHSKKSMEQGYDAKKTDTFKRVNLDFDPTKGFHEYRFDYMPGRVLFYADSVLLAEMAGQDMPSAAGRLMLRHWSNGDPKWSGGPPREDSILTVSYVKAYFNSSDGESTSSWEEGCQKSSTPVCVIPNGTAGNASTGGQYFTGSDACSSRREGLQLTSMVFLAFALVVGILW